MPTAIDPLLMVDINGGGRTIVTLHSGSKTRFYDLPNTWTTGAYPTNFAFLDVSSTIPPVGPGPKGDDATVGTTGGFTNADVVDKITVKFFGSGAVGFAAIPEPHTAIIWSVLGIAAIAGYRVRQRFRK